MRPTTNAIPTVDLDIWRTDPTAVAAQVDTALRRAGFLLVTGHGVDAALRAGVRAAARRFFALPDAVGQRYAVRIGGRGWLAPGVEANAPRRGHGDPAGPQGVVRRRAGHADRGRGRGRVVPAERLAGRGTGAACGRDPLHLGDARVADDLLELCATALGLPVATLTSLATNPTWTFNVNRYPPLTEVGQPADGQYRIGPHTDFRHGHRARPGPERAGCRCSSPPCGIPGEITLMGRGVWQDAPYDPDALTVNIGDLLAHWTGLRWSFGWHRVLPPQAAHPARSWQCRSCSSTNSTTTPSSPAGAAGGAGGRGSTRW
jgi:isopenicillin N synthase-like dioxygenase